MGIRLNNFIATKLRPVELALLAKKVLGIKRRLFTLDNGSVYYLDPVSDLGMRLMNKEIYEPEMANTIIDILKKNDTFIDLGSNEGYFTVLASKLCGTKGKVFAIEPQSRLWDLITRNCVANRLTNVTLIPYGIGSKNEELTMNLYPGLNTGASTFSSNFNFRVSFRAIRKFFYKTEQIKITTLDDLIDVLPEKVKLLKVDIEGFELEAMKGAKKMLGQKICDNILIELHHQALSGMNQSVEELDTLIKGYGYKSKVICSNLTLYSL